MKFCSLASGSKGNCLYLNAGDTALLVDNGLSLRETLLRMSEVGIDPVSVDAVLVTHEHIDHIRSAGSFARKFNIPVIASHLLHAKAAKYLNKTEVLQFESGTAMSFRDLLVDPVPVTHDSCDPVCFVIDSPEGRAASVTDLGMVTRLLIDKLKGSRFINLESNHDPDMLMNGPYPWELKQRIKSRHGHISNDESIELLHMLAHDDLQAVVFAHLSEVNNDPVHVSRNAAAFLNNQNICSPRMLIGEQRRASALIVV